MALVVFLLKFGFTPVGFEDPSSGEPIIIVPLPPQTLHEAGAWLLAADRSATVLCASET